MDIEKRIRNALGGDISLPQSTTDRLQGVYDEIRRQAAGKDGKMQKNNISRKDRRFLLVIAAAAAMAVFAGSALAYTITHYDFVNAVWRSGDTQQESQMIESYIQNTGKSVKLMNYTFTVEEYMLDENGMGFVRYSVENPNGLPLMNDATNGGIYSGGDSEGWFQPDADGYVIGGAGYCAGDDVANTHTFADGEVSAVNKMYFTDVFTFTEDIAADAIQASFFMYNEEHDQFKETVELDVSMRMPALVFGDSTGGIRAELSSLGVLIYGPDFSGAYNIDQLVVKYADESYTVIDDAQDIRVWRTATIGLDGAERVIFDRMVEPNKVKSITVNGYELTEEYAQTVAFNPDASPKAEVTEWVEADRSKLELAASSEENPFHYRREDGIEVFVLSNDTILGAADEDIEAYTAFSHGYLTYDEFLANVREDYDEYYSGKEFYAQLYPTATPAGCIDAQQAIELYLDLIAEYYPQLRSEVEYVVVSFRENAPESVEEFGCRYTWVLRNNTDAFWETIINAENSKLVSPHVVGLNGHFDETTGEWIGE